MLWARPWRSSQLSLSSGLTLTGMSDTPVFRRRYTTPHAIMPGMNDINKFLIPGAVVLAGLFIAGAVAYNGSHTTGSTGGTGTTGGTAVDVKNVKTSGVPFIGQANAPVTIVEWSDYQCPFCKQFEQTTLPQIIQNY